MKKDFLKTMLFMLCALCAFSFTACSDDDPADAASQVAGAYSGTLEVFMEASGDKPIATDTKTITLSKSTENSVNLVIQNFSLAVMGMDVNLGNVTISNCALTESGNGYSVAGTTTLNNVQVPVAGTSMSANCTVTLNNAKVVGNTLDMPLAIDVVVPTMGNMNLDVTADFTGTK